MSGTEHPLTHDRDSISYRPIGHVERSSSIEENDRTARTCLSKIVIDSDLTEGCRGLRVGEEIWVLFHCHLSIEYSLLQHPQGDVQRPKRGVFGLRSANRPNPIGLTQVKILSINANQLTVWGLDALDGSPVLDIKPALY